MRLAGWRASHLSSHSPFAFFFFCLFLFGMHVCIQVWAWLRDQTWRCGGFLRFIDLIFGIRLQLETILRHSNPGRAFFHSRCLPVRFIRAASRPYSSFSRPQQTPPFFRLGRNGSRAQRLKLSKMQQSGTRHRSSNGQDGPAKLGWEKLQGQGRAHDIVGDRCSATVSSPPQPRSLIASSSLTPIRFPAESIFDRRTHYHAVSQLASQSIGWTDGRMSRWLVLISVPWAPRRT